MKASLFPKGIAALLGPPLAGVLIEAVGHRGPALQVGGCHDVPQTLVMTLVNAVVVLVFILANQQFSVLKSLFSKFVIALVIGPWSGRCLALYLTHSQSPVIEI